MSSFSERYVAFKEARRNFQGLFFWYVGEFLSKTYQSMVWDLMHEEQEQRLKTAKSEMLWAFVAMFDSREALRNVHIASKAVRSARRQYKGIGKKGFRCGVKKGVVVQDSLFGGSHLVEKEEPCSLYGKFTKCKNEDCDEQKWNNADVELRLAKQTRNRALLNLFRVNGKK